MNLDRAAALIEKHGAARLRKSLGVWREELFLSQQELASLADVAQQTVSRVERGTRNLTPQVLSRLTNAMLKKEAEASKARGGKISLKTLMSPPLSQDAKEWRDLREAD